MSLIRLSRKTKQELDLLQERLKEVEGKFVSADKAVAKMINFFTEKKVIANAAGGEFIEVHLKLYALPETNVIKQLEKTIDKNIRIMSLVGIKSSEEIREDFDKILNDPFIQNDPQFKTNLDKYSFAFSSCITRNVHCHKVRWIVNRGHHLDKEKAN